MKRSARKSTKFTAKDSQQPAGRGDSSNSSGRRQQNEGTTFRCDASRNQGEVRQDDYGRPRLRTASLNGIKINMATINNRHKSRSEWTQRLNIFQTHRWARMEKPLRPQVTVIGVLVCSSLQCLKCCSQPPPPPPPTQKRYWPSEKRHAHTQGKVHGK